MELRLERLIPVDALGLMLDSAPGTRWAALVGPLVTMGCLTHWTYEGCSMFVRDLTHIVLWRSIGVE